MLLVKIGEKPQSHWVNPSPSKMKVSQFFSINLQSKRGIESLGKEHACENTTWENSQIDPAHRNHP